MFNDYLAQTEIQQHERELAETLEHRRVAAERDAMQFGGDRLALIAHLARAARTTRVAPARPISC